MKNLIASIILTLLNFTVCAQTTGTLNIKGTVKNYKPGQKVYLIGPRKRDSTTVVNGKFTFTGNITISNEPEENFSDSYANIFLDHSGQGINFNIIYIHGSVSHDSHVLYLEPGLIKVDIVDSAKYAVIKGGPLSKDHLDLDSIYHAYFVKMDKFHKNRPKLPPGQQDKFFLRDLDSAVEVFKEEQNQDKWRYVKTHTSSPVSLYLLKHNEEYYADHDKIAPYFEALSPTLKNTNYGKEYSAMLSKLKLVRIGAMAPAFTMNDQNGMPISLSSFKGKYLLIDLWASWCGPCRRENPNVVKAYNLFKNFNFTILGVSLDEKKDAWLQAIGNDQLTWTQVSDLRSWDNAVAQLYGVQAIPQNFLLDPEGKIIAKNLFGEDLTKKLESIFTIK